MFGFFSSPERKMRTNAANWLELADRVWHYRRDELSEADATELKTRKQELQAGVAARADAAKLKLAIERLEATLRRVGGRIYPKTALVENVEFFLVAAIVILGVRAYIVQPFKIPTNSMMPSYYGMSPEVFPTAADRPGPAAKVLRFLAFGAQRVEAMAPVAGEVSAEFTSFRTLAYAEVPGKHWFIFPAIYHEFTFYVNGQPTKFRVPEDFNGVEDVVRNGLLKGRAELVDDRALRAGEPVIVQQRGGTQRAIRANLGVSVQKAEPVVSFDIVTGDQLFVDRVSYNFVRPSVGDGFVFRTDNIKSPHMTTPDGQQIKQYYIKRLVGVPGDTLEIKAPVLYRNGQPITGAKAFASNAGRVGKFRGYVDIEALAPGRTMTVEPGWFLALGDNSGNSLDGRYWGFVPEKDVIGRPLFVYYPFTSRWGPPR